MVVGPEIRKTVKRFVLAVGFALLLPGMAGAAGFGPAEPSFWEDWAAKPAALLARVWEGWEGLMSLGTAGMTIDPNGEGSGTGSCTCGECGPATDPDV